MILSKQNQLFLKVLRKLYFKILPPASFNRINVEHDAHKASDLIYDYLTLDSACMITRFGSTELATVVNYLGVTRNNRNIFQYVTGRSLQWWWNDNLILQMKNWSGFFPASKQRVEQFCELMLSDMKYLDVLGSWLDDEKHFVNYIKQDVKLIHLRLLEPFWVERPWTRALAGKKILVVHPFASSILHQYNNNRENLFVNSDILPQFGSLTVIKAVQSLGGSGNYDFKDWFEALEYMKNEIDRVDYDICLIGAGAYGLPLAAHVKRSGKKGIHLGGALQLLFGIRGRRWEDPNYGVRSWGIPIGTYSNLMNSYWIRPLEEEQPKNAESVEGACYW